MKKIPVIPVLLLLLSGCAPMQQKVPDPVIVTVKEEVKIDPALLADCEAPAFMPSSMNQVEALKFAQNEAMKLIVCGSKHHSLAEDISRAFNVKPEETPPQSPKK